MGRFNDILTSPSLPLVVCTFLRTSSIIGITKTIGIYLEDINISLGTTSTDLGIALGLLNAFCHFPGKNLNLNYFYCDYSNPLPNDLEIILHDEVLMVRLQNRQLPHCWS